MITGFNTDVDFQGVTYHVQTEDKGLATPFVLSLVYNRGTILASKRSPYEDLVEQGFDEKVLAERLQKQHKTICAAIRAGKIEQLKEMTAKDAAKRKENVAQGRTEKAEKVVVQPAVAAAQTPPGIEPKPNDDHSLVAENEIPLQPLNPVQPLQPADSIQPAQSIRPAQAIAPTQPIQPAQPIHPVQAKSTPPPSEPAIVKPTQVPADQISAQTTSHGNFAGAGKISVYKGDDSPIPKPKYDFSIQSVPVNAETVPNSHAAKTSPLTSQEELVIEAVEIIEEEVILADEAVEIVTEITDAKLVDNRMKLQIVGDELFKSGEKKTMTILVHRGSEENGLSGAQVMVKVLGAAFRPLIFHGKTDQQGIAKVHLQMPLFKQGRAAILIKAMSEGEEIELRRTIKHK